MQVLIVPLWNWNETLQFMNTVTKCFNCTFMELKSRILVGVSRVIFGFNCTIMELKLGRHTDFPDIKWVLIVPLWNWNYRHKCGHLKLTGFNCTIMELKFLFQQKWLDSPDVLIVLLWNWNELGIGIYDKSDSVLIVLLWNWNAAAFVALSAFSSF